MQKPDRSSYSPLDFLSWKTSEQLAISPRFQRRSVWSTAAKSYLIDTIILGYPIPAIYIRVVKERGKKLPVREIIDGQQRITAIVEFLEGEFSLSRNIQSPYAGKRFEELPQNIQDVITSYSFVSEVFQGISDEDVLAIFSRLNTYSVTLNKQELRNGRFFGPFKQSAYALAYSHLTFWRNNNIFTETSIARMNEVELTSELAIAMMAGLQDKKKSIDAFYRDYDEVFSRRAEIERKFRRVIDEINHLFPEGLAKSEFRRVPLFYSMFLAIAHRLFGVPGEALPSSEVHSLSSPERGAFRETIIQLSSVIASARKGEPVGEHNSAFVNASLSQTDNIRPRRQRLSTIYKRAFD